MKEEIKKTSRQNHYMGGQIHHGFLRVLRKGFPLSDGRGYCKMCNWVWFENTGEVIDTDKYVLIHINGNKLDDRYENLKKITKEEFKKLRYQQVSETLKGHKVKRETKLKISEKLKGKPLAEETKKKISEANRGKKFTEETRENMRKAQQLLVKSGRKKILFGKKNPAWKGGLMFRKSTGYYYIHKPGFPISDIDGYVKRANYIWFQKTNEVIKPPFMLHHINGDKTDDRYKNLQKVTKKEHMELHRETINKSLKT